MRFAIGILLSLISLGANAETVRVIDGDGLKNR